MPMATKKIITGTPNLNEVFPASKEIKSNIEPTSRIFSVVKVI